MDKKILTHYGLYSLNDKYWNLELAERQKILGNFLNDMEKASEKTWFYQVYPSQTKFDILVWSNVDAEALPAPAEFLENQAKATNRHRKYIQQTFNLWGMTKPSQYSKAKRSEQEIAPFEDERKSYFVIYPFTKTADWYQKDRETRQSMMNDHIRIGKQYTEIMQLLLYSFGIQDQEFIVAYEMENLGLFSDLVYELRMTVARLYTLNDTPIITSTFKTKEQILDIFSGK